MKRTERVSIWVTADEKAALTKRASEANLDLRKYLRDDLFRRVRTRNDARVLDEIHRYRIDLNRVGGLLKLLSTKKVDASTRDGLSAALEEHARVVAAIAELPKIIAAKLDMDDDQEPEDDH